MNNIAKCIISIAAMEILCSKRNFRLLYELFKQKFQKLPTNETS